MRKCKTLGSHRFTPIGAEQRPPRPPTRRGLFPPERNAFDVHTSSDDDRDMEALIAIEVKWARLREDINNFADELNSKWGMKNIDKEEDKNDKKE